MTHDPLSDALRALPREKASAGFTHAVLARLDEPSPRRSNQWGRLLLAAAAMITLVAGLLLVNSSTTPVEQDQSARIEALESERERLERELVEIRNLARQAPSREIYLGGNDQVEVVFDVGWSAVQRADMQRPRSNITPASFPMNQGSEL